MRNKSKYKVEYWIILSVYDLLACVWFDRDDFVHFAKTCFENFADRVKYWVTINEPNIYAEWGYGIGTYPPGHCSPPFGRCSNGNSDVEPLIVVHNELLAHAKAAKLYREQFKVTPYINHSTWMIMPSFLVLILYYSNIDFTRRRNGMEL